MCGYIPIVYVCMFVCVWPEKVTGSLAMELELQAFVSSGLWLLESNLGLEGRAAKS